MTLRIIPTDEAYVREIAGWRYESPYDVYDVRSDEEAIKYMLDPVNRFYVIVDEEKLPVGFCSFGPDGQVPGGDYSKDALDIGMGVRPDLTGKGMGTEFVKAARAFAHTHFEPTRHRVTIAAFNKRARRVWEKEGFKRVQRFKSASDGRAFVVMTS